VTCLSCIASSSADWVFAGARLISSARRSCVKIGPGKNVKLLVCRSKTEEPVTSLGMRSGVNWMRLKAHPETTANVRATSVFPRPGAPSTRTCPRASAATRTPLTSSSWPMMTVAMCLLMRSNDRANSSAFIGEDLTPFASLP
jgi:hypothetical protein